MAEIPRRTLLTAGALLLAGAGSAPPDAYGFTMPSIDDGTIRLSDYRGQVLLVVNTASFCGYTPQYKSLEALYSRKQAAGLTVLGVPSQDFNQEYDSNGQVKAFCKATFNVSFPMAGICRVTGATALPFYQWVKSTRNGWQPTWNFCKVLIGRDGRILATFYSKDTPDGRAVTHAIDRALKA